MVFCTFALTFYYLFHERLKIHSIWQVSVSGRTSPFLFSFFLLQNVQNFLQNQLSFLIVLLHFYFRGKGENVTAKEPWKFKAELGHRRDKFKHWVLPSCTKHKRNSRVQCNLKTGNCTTQWISSKHIQPYRSVSVCTLLLFICNHDLI